MARRTQKGSILIYILISIFLMGMVIAALTQGAKQSATTKNLNNMTLYLHSDIQVIEAAIQKCTLSYQKPVDVDANGTIDATDNPNPPFPLYGDLSSGGAGTAVAGIKCPGAPVAKQPIFNNRQDGYMKMLADTATYTTTYFNDGTEGVYVRVTRATANALWTEAIGRVNAKYSTCRAAAVTAAGTCANGCFYFWILRRATSALGGEAGCP